MIDAMKTVIFLIFFLILNLLQAAEPSAIEQLTGEQTPLKANEKIVFFGDSITWQGGYIDRLNDKIQEK